MFVINCNLQRLDGPVRGNGKIIQELESEFRGAGWNVIKVIWGSRWDALFQRDKSGALMRRMMEVVDGEYQTYKSESGAYVREHFFNTPELKALVAEWSDEDIWNLNRGGHDPHKIYAAFTGSVEFAGPADRHPREDDQGLRHGRSRSGDEHHPPAEEAARRSAEEIPRPVPSADLRRQIVDVPYLKFEEGSKELEYMRARRQDLGGYLPARRQKADSLPVPELSAFEPLLKGTGEGREISTTMAFVRILNILLKDKALGKRIVPIVPDESRTFGMEGLFRQIGIWNQEGQKYVPEDSDQLMFYRESETGQILQEGINEAGGMCRLDRGRDVVLDARRDHDPVLHLLLDVRLPAHRRPGWAAGDMRSRGFLLGGTAGRTTLNGEGLQHEDGHSLLWAASVPNCISYDPTFGYELAVIMQDGLRRMVADQEDVYYYITVMNENYEHPAIPQGDAVAADIIKGMYAFSKAEADEKAPRVQLMGAGTIFNEVIAAAELLKNDWGVAADLWSVPSFTELAREGHEVQRWNLLHPTEEKKLSHVEKLLKDAQGPVIASTDYVRALTEQIRAFVPQKFVVLGTDGYGRSDTREKLRHFFEVDRYWVTVAALNALADEGTIERKVVAEALKKYNLDPAKPNPMTV